MKRAPIEPLERDFRIEDAEGFSDATELLTHRLPNDFVQGIYVQVADFMSEADASEKPSSDIDSNSMHAAHKRE